MDYSESIKRTRLVRDDDIEVVLTTGDLDYPGTAIEVTCGDTELFHIVVDEDDVQQVMFYPQRDRFRMHLSTLETIVKSAKEKVRLIGEY